MQIMCYKCFQIFETCGSNIMSEPMSTFRYTFLEPRIHNRLECRRAKQILVLIQFVVMDTGVFLLSANIVDNLE